MHPRHRIVALVASVLLASGCSSTDDPDRGSTSATPTTSVTADPTESAGASEAAESAGLDACDLLEPADYRRYVRKDLQASMTESHQLNGSAMNMCTVQSGPFSLFSFGYATDPDAWPAIERRTRPQKISRGGDEVLRKVAKMAAQKRRDVPNVADEAFFSENLGGNALHALDDGVSYQLGVVGLAGGRSDITLVDYMATMITMLGNASAGVDTDPVQLPAQCPPADSREVVNVLGEVSRAFGSAYRGKAPSCAYVGTDGRVLRASATVYATRALYDFDTIRPEQTEGMTVIDPAPGTTSGIRRDGRDWRWLAVLPQRLENVGIHTDRLVYGPRPSGTVDRKAFLAYVDAYRALATEQLGVKY